jgi:hypothetical protein
MHTQQIVTVLSTLARVAEAAYGFDGLRQYRCGLFAVPMLTGGAVLLHVFSSCRGRQCPCGAASCARGPCWAVAA